MSIPLRVLFVEDSEDDTLLLVRRLRQGGYDVTFERVETREAMQAALTRESWDVVIADYSLPRFNGLDALKTYRESGLDMPFIIVSGTIGEETAVQAMKAGAHDYVRKDNTARLIPAIERELREAAERRARREAERALAKAENERKHFYREVVLAITGGRLVLEERGETNLESGEVIGELGSPEEIGEVRRQVRERALAFGMSEQRADDLELAVGEAAANAWKHAGNGKVYLSEVDDTLRVTISDTGGGIDPGQLARAAFEKGYSTAQSLGMGYTLMISLTDRVRLITDRAGTTVSLEMARHARPHPEAWENWHLDAIGTA